MTTEPIKQNKKKHKIRKELEKKQIHGNKDHMESEEWSGDKERMGEELQRWRINNVQKIGGIENSKRNGDVIEHISVTPWTWSKEVIEQGACRLEGEREIKNRKL